MDSSKKRKKNEHTILQPRTEKKAYGLFSFHKSDRTTALQYVGVIVIGLAFSLLGSETIYLLVAARHREISEHGSTGNHLFGFLYGIGFIAIGCFVAHPGIIYWTLRIRAWLEQKLRNLK